MREYRPKLGLEADELSQEADRKFTQVPDASNKVDEYVLLTVMLSSVLFFSGLTTLFVSVRIQAAALLFATGLLLVAVTVLLRIPIA